MIGDQFNDDGSVDLLKRSSTRSSNLIWLAGFVFLLGSLIAIWPDAREQRRLAVRYDDADSPAAPASPRPR